MKLFFTNLIIFIATISAYGQNDEMFAIISQRIHHNQISNVKNVIELDKSVEGELVFLDTLTGKWLDVDYFDHKRIAPSWLPIMQRMRRLTLAYTHKDSKYFGSDKLWELINKSLLYFSTHKPLPYCDNWYQQGITRPQNLALSLVNMQHGLKPLRAEVIEATLAATCKDTAVTSAGRNNPMHKWNSGANKSEIAVGWIYISTLLKHEDMLRVASREVFSAIQLTKGEGIQYDMSYDFHFGYLYNGAYGLTFVRSVLEAADFLKGTPYALQGDKLNLLNRYFVEGVIGVNRGKWLDWNVLGRGISRVNLVQNDLTKDLMSMAAIDTARTDFYNATIRSLDNFETNHKDSVTSNRYFWHTDFTVHRRPAYYFSVHGASNRNRAQEIGNKENWKGYWGAQGTMNLMVRGDEYFNIFPVWDWTKLPGTTLPDSLFIPLDKAPGSGDRLGTSSFVGGVTDSVYGVKVYVVDNDLHTSYKKSWFMFDEEIVCLGAGINSSLYNKELYTTLNQVISNDKSVLWSNCKIFRSLALADNKFKSNIKSVLHDGVWYLLEGENEVELELVERKASWSEVRGNNENNGFEMLETKSVFYLGINHGIEPQDEQYAYRIFPGQYQLNDLKGLKKRSAKIISNSTSIQAVYHDKLKIHQVILHEANIDYKFGDLSLQSDIPCVMMLRQINDRFYLYFSDPTQKAMKANVKLKIGKRVLHQSIDLPQDVFAGSTVLIKF